MAFFTDISTGSPAAYVGADVQQYFISPLFLGNDVLAKFEVMGEIKGNMYLDHFSAASKITTADNGGEFAGVQGTIYSNPQISPKRVESEIEMNGNNFYNKVKGMVLRSGTSKDNVDGTVLKQIGAEIMMQGVKADFNRQLWFADTSSLLDSTAHVAHYQVYDGIFASLLAKLADDQIVAATYSTDITNAAATAALESVYQAATAELKELPKTFYVSGKIADDYERELTSKGNTLAYADLQSGIPSLNFRGIPLVVRRDWDVTLANDFASIRQIAEEETGGTPAVGASALGARIALIADNALVVGSDYSGASVENWYNMDAKAYRWRIGYTAATVLLDAKLAVLYGN